MVEEIAAQVLIVELGVTYLTPFTIELDVGTYTLRATYPATGETLPDRTTTITEGAVTREDFYFAAPPPTHTLTISSMLGGTTSPIPGIYEYDLGATVAVAAIPDMGYYFDHWELDGTVYTSNPINVLMDTDHNLMAYFSEEEPPPPPTYKLMIASTLGGTTNPIPGTYDETEGVTVTVTAIPESGYHFNHWELDGTRRTENPIQVLMDRDHTLLAVFSVVPPPPPTPCWIATATFGTALAPELYILRRFRNRCLPDTLVALYYATSKPIAEYIRNHIQVRHVLKAVLEIVVEAVRKLV